MMTNTNLQVNLVLKSKLRSEYIEKAKEIKKQKSMKVGTVSNLRKKLDL